MRGTTVNRPYALLAKYYDRLFTDYHSWGEATRRRLLGKILPRISSACDLACGTGTAALELSRWGISVYAVDLSPEMCDLARKKARRARLPLTVVTADMRSFRLPEPVDLVTCEYDAINHVPRRADLAKVARAVAQALRPGGYFYFDANNSLAFEKIWPQTLWIEKPGIVLVLHGGYDRRRHKAFSNIDLFVEEGNRWQRFAGRVEEVCWTRAEVRDVLRRAGFDQVRAWDSALFFKNNPAFRPGYRTFYLARKASAKQR